MIKIGIEKINLYGCSLTLDIAELAKARDKDPKLIVNDYLIDTRSLNPLWEDSVTMGVNAAIAMLTEEDKKSIGMLIVGTESSVDYGKPISTNILEALGLSNNVRNYEVKHACYCGVAALDTAANWIASGTNHGKKALVISSDFSRKHIGKDHEFVLGGIGAAVLVSDTPKILELEMQKKGTWSTNIYDTFRPTAEAEMGNNETSLFSYVDALEGAYENYVENVGEEVIFDTYFKYNIYHTPFPGMTFQAHRVCSNLHAKHKKSEIKVTFDKKVLPCLKFARKVGSTYGASNFVGLCSLLMSGAEVNPGDRIGFYAYGSGAIGEFYSGIILPGAREAIAAMNIEEQFSHRKPVTVAEYEQIENTRATYIDNPDFTPDFSILNGWFDEHYKGKKLFVLKKVENYYRTYGWA